MNLQKLLDEIDILKVEIENLSVATSPPAPGRVNACKTLKSAARKSASRSRRQKRSRSKFLSDYFALKIPRGGNLNPLFEHRWLRRYSSREYAVIVVVSLVWRRTGMR